MLAVVVRAAAAGRPGEWAVQAALSVHHHCAGGSERASSAYLEPEDADERLGRSRERVAGISGRRPRPRLLRRQGLAQAAFKHAETDAALDVCERGAAYGLAVAASPVAHFVFGGRLGSVWK